MANFARIAVQTLNLQIELDNIESAAVVRDLGVHLD